MSPQELGIVDGIIDVASGRGQFRFILQPLVAIFFGARLGIADAKEGKEPFLWRLITQSKGRAQLIKATATDLIVPFSVAVVVDGILQYLTLGYVRPLVALVTGAILIWLPYTMSRALTNRIVRRSGRIHRHAAS
jgi:hypothetical protein